MAASTDLVPTTHTSGTPADARPRSLVAACLAHALHDGYTDGLYAFLPVWQAQFGLSYAALALLRSLYYATMGGLQMPADRLLRTVSPRAALVLATVLAAIGMAVMASPTGFAGLCLGLVIAGIGSSIQHPRASTLITDAYGTRSRRPLGIYNFSGDLGKAILPAIVALLIPLLAWRPVLVLMAILGAGVSMALFALTPSVRAAWHTSSAARHGERRGGFGVLMTIGALDTATRMGYLLFLPFLVHGKGGDSPMVGVCLALVFIGGALGKATCGWLGDRVGVVGTVVLTEAATAGFILATLVTPLWATLVLLPLLGIVLNGTSSVLYGTVPELSDGDTGRAFALFYTGVIGSGGIAPILYGLIADHSSRVVGTIAAAGTALAILPLVRMLRPHLVTPVARA